MKQIIFGEHKNIIGKQLYKIRREKKVSQTELAARMQVMNVNMDQQMISKIEKNQRQVTDYEFVCFCKSLGVTYAEMLKDIEELL